MRTPLTIAALLVIATIGGSVALAQQAPVEVAEPAAPAPISVPAQPPTEDPAREGAYGYLTGEQLARRGGYEPSASAGASSAGSSATVTITAYVLPVRTIVVDRSGEVSSIVTNTTSTDAREAMYVARLGDHGGRQLPIDAELWGKVRTALAAASEGPGVIYERG